MILVVLLAIFFHPIHISVCEINYSENSRTLQFSQRIFADDLEIALSKGMGKNLDILKLNVNSRDSLLESYLHDKVELHVEGILVTVNYLGSEIEEGVCWVYFESNTFEKKLKSFTIKNIPLFELYEDQSTIIQVVKDSGDVINFRLHGQKPQDLINLY